MVCPKEVSASVFDDLMAQAKKEKGTGEGSQIRSWWASKEEGPWQPIVGFIMPSPRATLNALEKRW